MEEPINNKQAIPGQQNWKVLKGGKAQAQQHEALGRDAERKRFARELHDGPCQQLAGLEMRLELLSSEVLDLNPEVNARVEEIRQLVRETVDGIRAIAQADQPKALGRGLKAALEKLCYETQTPEQDVRLEVVDDAPLSATQEHELYRVAQEFIHNAQKHAAASKVSLRLSCEDQKIRFRLADNGCGFDTNQEYCGDGLKNMRCRIEGCGGELQISSAIGSGTVVMCTLPMVRN